MFNSYVKHLFVISIIFLAACQTEYSPVASTNPVQIMAANASESQDTYNYEGYYQEEIELVKPKPVEIRVGVLAPFSGTYKKLGTAIKNTVLMALYEISSDNIVVQFYDTKGTEEGAVEAISSAVSQDIDIVIGPVFAHEVSAVSGIAYRSDVDVLAFTSTPEVLGNNVYTLALLLPQQIEEIITYACNSGKQNFAVVTTDNDFGRLVIDSANNAVLKCENEAQIVRENLYSPEAGNMVSVIKELTGDRSVYVDAFRNFNKKEGQYAENFEPSEEDSEEVDILSVYKSSEQIPLDFDALLIADEGSNLRSLAAVLNYYDITNKEVMFLGTQQWSDPNLANEKALLGGYYPEIPVKGFGDFASRYRKIYGNLPPRIASQAYDGIALISVLANNGNFSSEAITDSSGFAGVDGIFRLLDNGYSERGMAIMQVAKPQAKMIKSPPQTFISMPVYEPEYKQNQGPMAQEQNQETVIIEGTETKEENPISSGLLRFFQ